MVSGRWRRRAFVGAGCAGAVLALALVGLAAWQWVALSRASGMRDPRLHAKDDSDEWAEVLPGLVLLGALGTLATAAAAAHAARAPSRPAALAFAGVGALAALVLIVVGSLTVSRASQPDVEAYVRESLQEAYLPARKGRVPEAATAFAAVERALECCGMDGARDYHSFRDTLPTSCCGDRRGVCDFSDREVTVRPGCADVIVEEVRLAYRWAGAGALLAGCACALAPLLAWAAREPRRKSPRPDDEPPDSDDPADD